MTLQGEWPLRGRGRGGPEGDGSVDRDRFIQSPTVSNDRQYSVTGIEVTDQEAHTYLRCGLAPPREHWTQCPRSTRRAVRPVSIQMISLQFTHCPVHTWAKEVPEAPAVASGTCSKRCGWNHCEVWMEPLRGVDGAIVRCGWSHCEVWMEPL